ncbi:srf-3 [Pristionchus pacificus]|nr:srf-3 [Pristionchus pacificus]
MCMQNAIHTLLIRYSRARKVDEMFLPSVAVFVTEIIKVVICVAVEIYNEGFIKFCNSFRSHTISQPWDTLKVCVPAMVYVIQNNLFYIAASHLEAATFMIFSQLKIFTTALFSMFILGRSLSGTQWAALFVLFIGVSLVQIDSSSTSKKSDSENPLIGLISIIIACVLSGFAGVYFEKILKGTVSLWMRNIQLALFAVPSSLVSVYAQDGAFVVQNGLLYGWDGVVCVTAFWYGIGGLSVAVCIKYADNIAKNFATSVAIILSTIGSVFFFSFSPSFIFVSGATLAIFSIFMYSSSNSFLNHIPRSLRSHLCL